MNYYRNTPKKFKRGNESGYSNTCLTNYLSKLLGYNYYIIYKPGKANTVADALSRCEASTSLTYFY